MQLPRGYHRRTVFAEASGGTRTSPVPDRVDAAGRLQPAAPPDRGVPDSLLRLMGLNLKAPDHTTLSRRNQIVAVPPLTRSYDGRAT